MAFGDSLPTNFSDPIREKFARISQIDQNVNRAIQECNQLGSSTLTTWIDQLREDHEDVKNRLRGFLEAFCHPNTIPLNLGVSQMEQEVFRVLRTTQYDLQVLLEPLMEVLEELSKEEEEIDASIDDLMLHFNEEKDANLRKKDRVASASESVIGRTREQLKDLSDSLVGGEQLRAADKKAIDQFVMDLSKASSSEQMEAEDQTGGGGDGQSLETDHNAEKTLEDVIVEIYGFQPTKGQKITASLANQKMIEIASDEEEVAGALKWACIKNLRRKFEALKKKLVVVDGVERDSQKGSEGMPMPMGGVEIDKMRLDILRVVKEWVYHLECNFIGIVHDLHAVMSGHEASAAKFQEFKAALRNLGNGLHGMVPIVVYKVLVMEEIPFQEEENVEGNSVATSASESSWATIEKGTLYERMEFDEMIDLLLEIILKFRCALITSGLPNAKPQNIDIEVLDSYEKLLQQSQAALEEIERKMRWAKYKPEEIPVPAGKGKMIMN